MKASGEKWSRLFKIYQKWSQKGENRHLKGFLVHCSDFTSFSKEEVSRREDPLSFLKVCLNPFMISQSPFETARGPNWSCRRPPSGMEEARGNVYSQPTRTWRPRFCHCPAAAGRGQTLVCSRQNDWPAALPWRSLEHNIYIFQVFLHRHERVLLCLLPSFNHLNEGLN